MVPPCALDVMSGSSGSVRSDEFRARQYLSAKTSVERLRSLWKIWGSLRKMKDGLWMLVK